MQVRNQAEKSDIFLHRGPPAGPPPSSCAESYHVRAQVGNLRLQVQHSLLELTWLHLLRVPRPAGMAHRQVAVGLQDRCQGAHLPRGDEVNRSPPQRDPDRPGLRDGAHLRAQRVNYLLLSLLRLLLLLLLLRSSWRSSPAGTRRSTPAARSGRREAQPCVATSPIVPLRSSTKNTSIRHPHLAEAP